MRRVEGGNMGKGEKERRRDGDAETWRNGDLEKWGLGDLESWRLGDLERGELESNWCRKSNGSLKKCVHDYFPF
jgi:hypothetical protein